MTVAPRAPWLFQFALRTLARAQTQLYLAPLALKSHVGTGSLVQQGHAQSGPEGSLIGDEFGIQSQVAI
jgi:hypothetical protein